jgi:phosphoglycerate kinase
MTDTSMTHFRTLDDLNAAGKVVLVRVDFNVPMANGAISDDTRLQAALPTVAELSEAGARVVLLAHFDRPKGKRVPALSLAPIAPALSALLDTPVAFADDCVGEAAKAAIAALPSGGVLLLENLRFHAGEEANDAAFAAQLAALGDVFVNDAFSCAHRAHASTEGVTHHLPSYAGRSMQMELEALDIALGRPQRPVVGVVGGAKVSTKLDLLKHLVTKLDVLVIGGGMANTFLAAQGIKVGKSLCEHDLADTARAILRAADAAGCDVMLPGDVVCAKEFKANALSAVKTLDAIADDDLILDAGPGTVTAFSTIVHRAKTVIWNGPLGAFELTPFDAATVAAARAVADATDEGLVSVAGGGDTVAALNHAGVADRFSFISTAGGAFLEWMEGRDLPGVIALQHSVSA